MEHFEGKTEPKVKSLYKALLLLDCFDLNHPERGVAELAEISGMLKSSVHNIMSTFVMLGYISQDEKTHRYRLGYKLLEKGYLARSTNAFQQQVRPFLEEAARLSGESVTYAIRSGIETVYLDTAYPPMTTVVRLNIGARHPMYSTAGGKAILAFSPRDIFDRVCRGGMTSFTDQTITTSQALDSELKKIRELGYAIDNMENEYGIRGFAMPLWNHDNMLMGALSLSGPSPRISQERIKSVFVPIFSNIQKQAKTISC